MISSIRGEVLQVALDHVIVDVAGFGLQVTATPQTLMQLRPGRQAMLQTSFVPRQDDAPLLFGFADAEEREIFTTLLGISGVGPRLALAVLSVHSPPEVRGAIADSDTAAFTKVPGIGKKTAQRILLELAGKLVVDQPRPDASDATQRGSQADQVSAQVQDALSSLGWTEKDARHAMDRVLTDDPDLAAEQVSVVLRQTLRMLGAAPSGGGLR